MRFLENEFAKAILILLFFLPAIFPPLTVNVCIMFGLLIGSKYIIKRNMPFLRKVVILQNKFFYASWIISGVILLLVSYFTPLLILNFWFPNTVVRDYWQCYLVYFSLFFTINLLFRISILFANESTKKVAYKVLVLFLFFANVIIYYITLGM